MGLFDWFFGDDEVTTTLVQTPGPYSEAARALSFGIASSAAERTELMWDRFVDVYQPYEDKIIKANKELIQPSKDLALMSIQNQKRLLGPTTDFTLANIQAQMETLPLRTEAAKEAFKTTTAQSQAIRRDIGLSEEVSKQFFDEAAVSGKELGIRRAGQAVAGVESQFKNVQNQIERQLGSFGIDPSSGAFKSAARKIALEKARARSGAVTSAKERAEQEAFNKKSIAMGIRGATLGLPTAGTGTLPFTSTNVPLQSVGLPSGPALSQPLSAGTAQQTAALAGLPGVMSPSGSTQTQTGGGSGFGDIAGTALGIYLGRRS